MEANMPVKKVSDKLFDSTIKALVKNFGAGYDNRGLAESKPEGIPTGHDDLDDILTKGASGIYLGGLVEILGSEGGGKTSIALRVVGNAQRLGHRCCWIDAEAGFDEGLATLNGCDPTELVMPDLADTRAVNRPSDSVSFFNATEILEMIYKTIISNVFGVIILDSVAGLMPERVLKDDFDANKMGVAEVARSLAQMLGKIAQACKKTKTTAIFINQRRDKPGTWFEDKFHTPGGRALKHYAHQRISVEKKNGSEGKVYADEDGYKTLIGHYAKIVIVKNKKAPPVPDGMVIEVPIYYKKYFPDNAKKCYDLARQMQIIKIRNGVLTWKEDDVIILQEEGESVILSKIRDNKMENHLAFSCMSAETSEINKKRKIPIRINQGVKDLASKYSPDKQKRKMKDIKTSKDKGSLLDLSDTSGNNENN